MERKTNTRIRNGLAALTGATALSAPVQAQSRWFNFEPAYNLNNQSPTLRLEGGADLGHGLDFYGFVDIDAGKEKSVDLETFYGEGRLSYSLKEFTDKLDGFKLAAEYDVGTGMDDRLRLGLTYNTSLGKGNFTSLRAFPFETSGDSGPKLGIFTTQDITDRLSAQLLANYFPDSRTFYIEPELDLKIGDRTNLFIQGRAFGEFNKDLLTNMAPVIGIKFKF